MEVSVLGQLGETVETINLDDAVFNIPMNNSLVHQAMVTYQLNKRHGTHDTKTRAQVSGGGRKPWIQKHTGRARQGSIRAPQWRHGGVVFGPHPRSYRQALPRRMRRAALRCVLSQKARDGRLVCLNSLDAINGKTTREAVLWAEESLISDPHGRVARSGRSRAPVMEQQVLEVVGLSTDQEPVVEPPIEADSPADQATPEQEPGSEDQA